MNAGGGGVGGTGGSLQGPPVGPNPFLDPPQPAAIEYKKGYVMRKCCYETNYKKSKSQECQPRLAWTPEYSRILVAPLDFLLSFSTLFYFFKNKSKITKINE